MGLNWTDIGSMVSASVRYHSSSDPLRHVYSHIISMILSHNITGNTHQNLSPTMSRPQADHGRLLVLSLQPLADIGRAEEGNWSTTGTLGRLKETMA